MMKLKLSGLILYLITRGASTENTDSSSTEFQHVLDQISAAADAGIQLIQIREKNLTARVLYELTMRAVEITRGSSTRILVNDRADVAAGAGADGVHLTTKSLDARTMRANFGEDFLIGSSAHSLGEATTARDQGADFAVFGPVFETESKAKYGAALGLDVLAKACATVKPFPILALGGISAGNAAECLNAGASGVAGISLFGDVNNLRAIAESILASVRKESNHV